MDVSHIKQEPENVGSGNTSALKGGLMLILAGVAVLYGYFSTEAKSSDNILIEIFFVLLLVLFSAGPILAGCVVIYRALFKRKE